MRSMDDIINKFREKSEQYANCDFEEEENLRGWIDALEWVLGGFTTVQNGTKTTPLRFDKAALEIPVTTQRPPRVFCEGVGLDRY